MRGFGDFQRGQMKQVDPLVPELFRSMRQVIDILERLTIDARSAGTEEAVTETQAKPTEKPAMLQTLKLAYSIGEVSKQAGLGRSRIYQAIASGELRATKCGKRTLVRTEDLRAWIDSWPTVLGM